MSRSTPEERRAFSRALAQRLADRGFTTPGVQARLGARRIRLSSPLRRLGRLRGRKIACACGHAFRYCFWNVQRVLEVQNVQGSSRWEGHWRLYVRCPSCDCPITIGYAYRDGTPFPPPR